MRYLLVWGCVALLLAGCGAPSATPTVTPGPTAPPVASPSPVPAQPTATVTIGRPFAAFLTGFCAALRGGAAPAVMNVLPNYEYNSGLRFGFLGDGAGQTGDPSLLNTWLSRTSVRCQYFTPGIDGHGTVLTSGWRGPARWALIELDIFNGHWKINDFTFGSRQSLFQAMHVNWPIMRYHAGI